MSCRVFNRELELAIFDEVVSRLSDHGVNKVKATYIESPKNSYVYELYEQLGFEIISSEGKTKEYLLDTSRYKNLNLHIEVTRNGK